MASIDTDRDALEQRCRSGTHADAWVGFLRAHSAVVKALDADLIASHGLPLSAYEVLMHLALAEDGHLRMSDLAERALLSQSRISRLVEQLVRQGLVERTACPTDSRVVYAKLTGAGRQRFEEAEATHFAGVQERFFGRLSSGDLERLGRIWRRVLAPADASGRRVALPGHAPGTSRTEAR